MSSFNFNLPMAFESLKHLTVFRVVTYLAYTFQSADDEIMLEDTMTTPAQVGRLNSASNASARLIPVKFWGGPPGAEDWYAGSLLSMLIDRLFYSIAVGDTSTVRRFQESFTTNAK